MKREHAQTLPDKAVDLNFFEIEELAERLRMSVRTIQRRVRAGNFPKPIEPTPNRRIWPVQVIREWVDSLLEANQQDLLRKLERSSPEMRMTLIKEKIAELLRLEFDSSIAPEDVVIRLANGEASGATFAFIDFSAPQHIAAPQEASASWLPHPKPYEAGIFRLKPGTILPTTTTLSQLLNLPPPSGHAQTLLSQMRAH